MTNVEHIKSGFQWAEPLQGNDLALRSVGLDLEITGLAPTYAVTDSPCDLIRQFEKSPKRIPIGQARTGTQSPEVIFANADTDEKLMAFVRKFGPVVARECSAVSHFAPIGPPMPTELVAHQDMQELRNEHVIFRAALTLVIQLDQETHKYVSVQELRQAIAGKAIEVYQQSKAKEDADLIQHVMKIIQQSFAQELDQPRQCEISVAQLLKIIAANLNEKIEAPNYASALQLMEKITASVKEYLDQPIYDYFSAQERINAIATNVKEWLGQWDREKSQRESEPRWKLSNELLTLIEVPSYPHRDPLIPDYVAGRRVICGLLNSFPSIVFPNQLELHSSIRFGIRPLLYSLLRRQFINPRGFGFCRNPECRNFFTTERAGQQFCSSECSLQLRQRIYWQQQGKKLREKRIARAKKMRKQAVKPVAKLIARKKIE